MPKSFSFLSLASALVAASARQGPLESATDFSSSPSALMPYPLASSSPLPMAYEPCPSSLMLFNGGQSSPHTLASEQDIVCFDDINDPPWNGSAKLPVVPVGVNIGGYHYWESIELMRDMFRTAFDGSSLLDSYKLIPRCEAVDPYLRQLNFCNDKLLLRFATNESLNDEYAFSNLTALACQLYKDYIAKKSHDSDVLVGIVLGGLMGGFLATALLFASCIAIHKIIKTYRARALAAEEAHNRLLPEAYAVSAERPDGAYGTARALTVFGRRPGATAPQLPRAIFTGQASLDQAPLLSINGGDARIASPLNFGDKVDADLLRLAGMSVDAAAAAPLIRNAPRGYGTGGAV